MKKTMRYVLLKDGKETGTLFSSKQDAAEWQRASTKTGLDWSANFSFKLKGDSTLYQIVDIKTRKEPSFDWGKIKEAK
jgi:hypothetical protein